MKQQVSSTSSNRFKAIGAGRLIPYLRADLRRARESILVIGPWIDGYFIDILLKMIKKTMSLRFLVRLNDSDGEVESSATLASLEAVQSVVSGFQARYLPTLHAKVIVVDNNVVYLGSTNWYEHSLLRAEEVTLRGTLSQIEGLETLLDDYWESSSPVPDKMMKAVPMGRIPELTEEILDPYARAALRKNPKAFIKRVKSKGSND